MKIIDHIQGSSEWLNWRKGIITGTDASVIIGSNPFKSPLDLYEEKLGLVSQQSDNAAMKRGRDLEPIARQIAIEEIGVHFEPICVVHSDYYFMGASLDGYSECNGSILEIKCPSKDTHRLAVGGDIKPYYMTQIQHQLACTGALKCYYFSYNPEYTEMIAILEIKPDLDYIKAMIEAERKFYEEHLCLMNPPETWKLKLK